MKLKESNFHSTVDARITNLRLRDVGATAEASALFPQFQADRWKAYVEFDICHSIPEVAGPVQLGNYIGYFPATLESSHGSLVHQQFNERHLLKAYGSEKQPIARDHIIGCVVGTAMPRKPMQGWRAPGKPDGATTQIHCCAVMFKLAQGVGRLLGDHLASKAEQSVSIEVISSLANCGVYRPSTDELHPLLEPTEEFLGAYKEVRGTPMPAVGEIDGEKLVVIYGMGEPVEFRGVGMTPNPAERAAKVTSITAEAHEMWAIAAEAVPSAALLGRKVTFKSKRVGTIHRVFTEGKAYAPGVRFAIAASLEEPVVSVRFANGDFVLRKCEGLAEAI